MLNKTMQINFMLESIVLNIHPLYIFGEKHLEQILLSCAENLNFVPSWEFVNNCIYKMFRFFHNNVSDCLSRSSPPELIGQPHLLEPSESKFVSEIRKDT